MIPPQISLRRRLVTVGAFVLVTFLLGSLIFQILAHGETAKYYWLAVALFPAGFVILGLGQASVAAGWTAYVLCLGAMLGFARRKPFLVASGVLAVLIVVNLFGCAVTLKG